MYLPVLMCSTYFWCSMRFHKCVSACISVYYVFLVQYALDPGFTRPQELISGGPAPNFTQLRLLSLSFLISPCYCHCIAVGPFHYNSALNSSSRGPRVALSACLGLACLSNKVSPLLVLEKGKSGNVTTHINKKTSRKAAEGKQDVFQPLCPIPVSH